MAESTGSSFADGPGSSLAQSVGLEWESVAGLSVAISHLVLPFRRGAGASNLHIQFQRLALATSSSMIVRTIRDHAALYLPSDLSTHVPCHLDQPTHDRFLRGQ